jgi:hypothetical protein
MTNRVTRGRALVGAFSGPHGCPGVFAWTASIARTDTVAKVLFTLPRDAVILALHVFGAAVSNAGTTATISVGKQGGNGHEYLNAFDVKGSTGAGQQTPSAAAGLGVAATSDTVVTGIYAETGTASTTGGPWTVTLIFSL